MTKNDVVQFTENHKWCGCLGIISEDKGEGHPRRYMIGVPIPDSGTAYIFGARWQITLEDGKSFPKGEALYGTFDDSEGRVALYGGRLVDKGTCKGAYFHGIGMANVIWAETQDTKADR